MDDTTNASERRRLNDLFFFGKIMANVSHEFNNVLTVITELSGLLEDLSLLAERGRPISPEKLQMITRKFSQHLARGKELITNMNRFSHSVDTPRASLDLKDVVKNMQVLIQRLVDRRQATLECSYSENGTDVTTDPFAVRHALFACFEWMMKASSPTPAYKIELISGERGADIVFSCHSEFGSVENGQEWSEMVETVESFGGRVELDHRDQGVFVKIAVPKDPGEDA